MAILARTAYPTQADFDLWESGVYPDDPSPSRRDFHDASLYVDSGDLSWLITPDDDSTPFDDHPHGAIAGHPSWEE